MSRFVLYVFVSVGLLLSASALIAQDDACPALVQQALETTDEGCATTGRNQACYGNIKLEAEPQPDVSDFAFDAPGDLVSVADVQTLTLNGLDESAGEWGISLMKIQANLPDTLPGQNVTLLLFGDVEIENATTVVPEAVLFDVTATSTINVRSGPSTNYAVVRGLANGETAPADGRNEAGDWLRIRLSDNRFGWVYAPLVEVAGDMTALPVMTADDGELAAPAYGPMQAFTFRSGIGDAPCAEAPNSGILIQTPEGAGEVELLVDEARIRLGSTIFLQAQPNTYLLVYVLAGQANVAAFGVERTVPAGGRVAVPLDANLAASGPPSDVEDYLEAAVEALPVNLLDIPIEAADSPPILQEGMWHASTRAVSGDCSQIFTGSYDYTIELDGDTLIVGGAGYYKLTEPGVYVLSSPHGPTTLVIESPTKMKMDYKGSGRFAGCVVQGEMVYLSEE